MINVWFPEKLNKDKTIPWRAAGNVQQKEPGEEQTKREQKPLSSWGKSYCGMSHLVNRRIE